MKHFLALPALLRTAALLASASQNSFSVHDDLLAFPQYEVKFVDEWTGEQEAEARLASNDRLRSEKKVDQTQLQHQKPLGKEDGDDDGKEKREGEVQYEHERMVIEGQPWLCRIPLVKRAEPGLGVNDTLSKADEEKELARANERGWELISAMQGDCVYFISGWWSYRFCYGQGIKQFHQLPPSRGVPVYPPIEDPGVPGYMLGTYEKRIDDDDSTNDEKWEHQSALDVSEGAKRKHGKHGELVQRGESRYLVQKLGGGTICDLTGKERKIEVQFHCNPQSSDRISLIKETSTCAYLMVIQTPRLCADLAFLPPQKDQPNAITCSPILQPDQVDDYERDIKAIISAEEEVKKWEATQEAAKILGGGGESTKAHGYVDVDETLVGDIYVGERRLVPPGIKLEKSAIVGGGKETYVDTVASSDGKILSLEEMQKLGLGEPKAIEKLRKELEKIAGGQNWKLDVIDTPRGREYRGIIGDDADEEEKEEGEEGDGDAESQGEDGIKGKSDKRAAKGGEAAARNKNEARRKGSTEGATFKKVVSNVKEKKKKSNNKKEETNQQQQSKEQTEKKEQNREGSEEELFYKEEL